MDVVGLEGTRRKGSQYTHTHVGVKNLLVIKRSKTHDPQNCSLSPGRRLQEPVCFPRALVPECQPLGNTALQPVCTSGGDAPTQGEFRQNHFISLSAIERFSQWNPESFWKPFGIGLFLFILVQILFPS